jgi:hypothetical protein
MLHARRLIKAFQQALKTEATADQEQGSLMKEAVYGLRNATQVQNQKTEEEAVLQRTTME